MGKQFQNYRFRKTEEAIIDAFFASKDIPTTGVLARRAGVSRSTLFRHHKTVYKVVPNYERRMYNKYTKMLRQIFRNGEMKEIYLKILVFIVANKRFFKLILAYKDSVIFEKMIWRLESKICSEYCLPRKTKLIFGIYVKEIAGVLEEWGKCEFDMNKTETVLRKIMYLTETIQVRLLPILKKD